MTDAFCDPNCQGCGLVALDEQPPDDIEFRTIDGIFIKEMSIAKAGTVIPQHSHRFDHTSYLALGSARVWSDGMLVGDFDAPHPIFIRAGVKHTFLSLTDNMLVLCIHNLHGAQDVEIVEQNALLTAL